VSGRGCQEKAAVSDSRNQIERSVELFLGKPVVIMIRSVAVVCFLAASSLVALSQNSDSVAVTHMGLPPAEHSSKTGACSHDLRSDPNAGVVISDIVLNGAALSSSEISTIKSQIVGECFDEHSDDIAGAIRSTFQDQGYAQADVENVSLKAGDALAVPKPVTVEADITEGPRFRFGKIILTGYHALSASKLKSAIPIKVGDLYRRSEIKIAIVGIRGVYAQQGFQDLRFVPDVAFSSSGTVILTITIFEGTQYHMGELKIYAKKEISDRLGSEWKLIEGAIFDSTYPQTFIDDGHSLPAGFGRDNIVLVKNCPEATVAVLLIVDQTDPGLQNPPKEVKCKKDDAGQ
jgi:hypothetical protein